jgi:hypothetical protein
MHQNRCARRGAAARRPALPKPAANAPRAAAPRADPYINSDAGTMSPFEHGEVFVLDDGGEARWREARRAARAGARCRRFCAGASAAPPGARTRWRRTRTAYGVRARLRPRTCACATRLVTRFRA